jgi:hypothetical protein
MTKTKRVRWVCPECGVGALGSTRPRANASVRFCFPCSTDAGVLVERTAPSLERKRAAAKTRAKEKAAKKAAREDAQWMTQDGLDLRKELRRLWKLDVWEDGFKNRKAPPKLTVHWSRNPQKYWVTGHAKGWAYKIHLTLPIGCDRAKASQVLLHELTHVFVEATAKMRDARLERDRGRSNRDVHGELFTSWLFQAACEAYSFDIKPDWTIGAYPRDRQMERAMRETAWFAKTGETLTPKPPRRKGKSLADNEFVFGSGIQEEMQCLIVDLMSDDENEADTRVQMMRWFRANVTGRRNLKLTIKDTPEDRKAARRLADHLEYISEFSSCEGSRERAVMKMSEKMSDYLYSLDRRDRLAEKAKKEQP